MPLEQEQGEQEQFNVAITEALGALGHACQQMARAGTHALNLDEPLIVGKVIAHQDALANTSDLVADLIYHLDIVHRETVPPGAVEVGLSPDEADALLNLVRNQGPAMDEESAALVAKLRRLSRETP